MASNLRSQFEAEAAKQAKAATPPGKPEPTGVAALLKKHKEAINPPPPKVSWKENNAGKTGVSDVSHVRYEKQGGKPTGPPPKKSLTDLP